MTIHLAGLLKDSGLRPVIISRGYRGKGDPAGGVVSDGRSIYMDAQTGGDEPYLMASLLDNVPVVIGKDRFAAGWEAIRKFRPDVILLDDAFQHMRLQRDLNILLLDSGKPLGNGHLLPRGSLREPLRAAVRSDAIVLTRSGAQPPLYYEHLCRAVAPPTCLSGMASCSVPRQCACRGKHWQNGFINPLRRSHGRQAPVRFFRAGPQ